MTGWLRQLFHIQEEEHDGANLDYANDLHRMAEDFRLENLRRKIALEVANDLRLDLDLDRLIIEDIVTLRLSISELVEHMQARWNDLVEPKRVRLLSEVHHAA